MKRNHRSVLVVLISVFCLLCTACQGFHITENSKKSYSMNDVPEFSKEPYVELTDNVPEFTEEEKVTDSFEQYSELDALGRCGQAYANISREIMPTQEREAIGMVKPSGWQTVKYDSVDGKYLYNRCHLIGYQLAGENANEKNLITGTRYMNVEGMLPFENEVAEYVKDTNHHVLYRVTPIYEGSNLVATGVEMEAWSVEDEGEGVCFHVFVYNSQPGIDIDYSTGDSRLAEDGQSNEEQSEDTKEQETYILNTNTKKYHKPSCDSAKETKAKNKKTYEGNLEDLAEQGYMPCSRCNP